jgi:hypothetical protein
MKKILCAAFVAALLGVACSGSSTAPSGDDGIAGGSPAGGGSAAASGPCANDYYPVARGNNWNYEMDSSVSGPTVYGDMIGKVASDGFTLVSEVAGVKRTAQWQCTPEGLVSLSYGSGPSMAVQTSDTQLSFKTSNVTGVTIPVDMQPGDTWQQSFDVSGTNTIGGTPTVTKGAYSTNSRAVGESKVTVPAGSFDALEVETNGTLDLTVKVSGVSQDVPVTFKLTQWYVLGIGMVETNARGTFMGTSISSRTTLQDYRLGG